MALTLLVVVASQFPRVRDDIDQVANVIPLFVAFLVVDGRRGLGCLGAGRCVSSICHTARAVLVFTRRECGTHSSSCRSGSHSAMNTR